MNFYLFFWSRKEFIRYSNQRIDNFVQNTFRVEIIFLCRDNELTTCDRYQREMETENLEEKQFSPFTVPVDVFLRGWFEVGDKFIIGMEMGVKYVLWSRFL